MARQSSIADKALTVFVSRQTETGLDTNTLVLSKYAARTQVGV